MAAGLPHNAHPNPMVLDALEGSRSATDESVTLRISTYNHNKLVQQGDRRVQPCLTSKVTCPAAACRCDRSGVQAVKGTDPL